MSFRTMSKVEHNLARRGITLPPLAINKCAPNAKHIDRSSSQLQPKRKVLKKDEFRQKKAEHNSYISSCQENTSKITPIKAGKEHTHLLTEQQITTIKEAFQVCDIDGSGSLTVDEIRTLTLLLGKGAENQQILDILRDSKCDEITCDCFIRIFANYFTDEKSSALSKHLLRQCKKLKKAFMNCDTNHDGSISQMELEIVLQKMNIHLSDDELNKAMKIIDKNNSGYIDWNEFALAIAEGKLFEISNQLGNCFIIENLSSLPSFYQPNKYITPTESDCAIKKMSFIERIGVRILTNIHRMHHINAKKRSSIHPGKITQSNDRTVKKTHVLANEDREYIRWIKVKVIAVAVFAGFISGALTLEAHTYTENMGIDNQTVFHYSAVGLASLIAMIIEIFLMYTVALQGAMSITKAAKLTLWPLDKDRAFIVSSIARSALQIGHPRTPLFGVNPVRNNSRLILFLTIVAYKGKRTCLNTLAKLFIKRFIWRAAAKALMSFTTLAINCTINYFVIKKVMRQAKVSALGPSAALDILQYLLHDDEDFVTPAFRVQLVRCVGCVIVCKKKLHPNIEIILQQVRNAMIKRPQWPIIENCQCMSSHGNCKVHELDSDEVFLEQLRKLSKEQAQEKVIILSLFILCFIIDGQTSFSFSEKKLYYSVVASCNLIPNLNGVKLLAKKFRNGHQIEIQELMELAGNNTIVVQGFTEKYSGIIENSYSKISSLLAC